MRWPDRADIVAEFVRQNQCGSVWRTEADTDGASHAPADGLRLPGVLAFNGSLTWPISSPATALATALATVIFLRDLPTGQHAGQAADGRAFGLGAMSCDRASQHRPADPADHRALVRRVLPGSLAALLCGFLPVGMPVVMAVVIAGPLAGKTWSGYRQTRQGTRRYERFTHRKVSILETEWLAAESVPRSSRRPSGVAAHADPARPALTLP